MADVFISYSRADRERIIVLAHALEAEGFSVWWDHQIAGGARFAAEIEHALAESRAIIVAWSASGILSEWVMDEADVGKRSGKLIPITLDGTASPIGFRQYQVLEFSRWKGSPEAAAFGDLVRSIRRFLHGKPLPAEVLDSSVSNHTLAVLPLENLGGDPAQQYFVDGMHSALIASLSRISALNVISRTSTRMYANVNKPLREIGAELGAGKIIEGSVYRDGDRVQISIQLINVATDTHDWSETYERKLHDILQLQRDAARDIAGQVSVVLTPAEQTRLASAPRVSPSAFDAYLKGMHNWHQLGPESLNKGIAEFERSLTADADFAPAYAGIGDCWAGLQQMGAVAPAVAQPEIKRAVDKALSLDPNLAEAHFARAVYCTWSTFEWDMARLAFERAIELDSSFPDAFAYYAHFLLIVGEKEAATVPIERAVNLDPYNPLIRGLYTGVLMCQGKLEQALLEGNRVLHTDPDNWLAYEQLRTVHQMMGNERESIEAHRAMFQFLGLSAVDAALADGYHDGDYSKGMTRGAQALAALARDGSASAMQVVQMYDYAGETDKAAEFVELAYQITDPALPYLCHTGIYSRALLLHPKVQGVLHKMQFPGGPVQ